MSKTTTEFPFEEIRRLVAEGRSDEALDIVFDVLDRWMTEGRFGEVDAVLAAVNLDDCDLTVAMGYVRAGSWARENLPSYAAFVARVRPWVVARVGEMLAAELLAGFGG